MIHLEILCITDPEPKCSATHLVLDHEVELNALMVWREKQCKRLKTVQFNHSGTIMSNRVKVYQEIERRWHWVDDGYWRRDRGLGSPRRAASG